MPQLLLVVLLSILLGGWLRGQAAPRPSERSAARSVFEWALLSLVSAYVLRFSLPIAVSSGELPPLPSGPQCLRWAAASLVCGAAAFGAAFGRRQILRGAACGVVWGALGVLARTWLALAAALSLAGGFFGVLLSSTMPCWLAAAAAAAAFACCHPEARAGRGRIVLAILLSAALPAGLVWWRLKASWDYGPRSIFEASGVARAAPTSDFSIAWLRPSAGEPYAIAPFPGQEKGADISYESLAKLYRYLERTQGRGLFAGQALDILRAGWLRWWDADRALQADLLSYPKRSRPDYLAGLALLRAGPLTPERYAILSAFDDAARGSSRGFEDVNRSQLIFEAFSAAYARFGDDQKARDWIYRVDNLWPIYDKKVEVSPVESFRGGTIAGSVLEGRRPAAAVRVGLFFVATSSAAEAGAGALSSCVFLDGTGRFRFTDLGAGRYYLGLLALSERLSGRILGAPGIIELTPEVPQAALEPIHIEP